MGLRVAIISRLITFAYKRSIKNSSKMPCSVATSSRAKVFGSRRLHPYAQQLPIESPSNILQPKPTRAAAHPVLGYRSRSNSNSNGDSNSTSNGNSNGNGKSSSTSRRRRQISGFSDLNADGTYDAADDMSLAPMQIVEPISYAETEDAQDHDIEREEPPHPYELPCPFLPEINQESNGTDYMRLMATRSSSDLTLPLPTNYTSYDDISSDQLERLRRGPVRFLDPADIGARRSEAQVQALLHPRLCTDSNGEQTTRFVTDCSDSSGRVYDRLFRRELARVSPYAGTSFGKLTGHVFDAYTGVIRKRCMFDDLRDINARTEGCLDVIDRDCNLDYNAVPGS